MLPISEKAGVQLRTGSAKPRTFFAIQVRVSISRLRNLQKMSIRIVENFLNLVQDLMSDTLTKSGV